MTKKQQGESLWGENSLKYKCECTQIAGKPTCPIHNKPIKEQMIYGNDNNISSLNEKEDYKKYNLNEGR
jgi:hypothetical protein